MRRARIKSVCAEALGIKRKNSYRQLKLPAKDQALKQLIEAVHRQHPAYGHRRIALHLGINHKRAQRVMAQFNLRPPGDGSQAIALAPHRITPTITCSTI